MEETKPVHEIIEEVQTEICDNYCKYTEGYKDADDEKYSDLVNRYCVSCPLRNLEDALDSYCELNEEGKTAFRMAIEALSCSENPNNSDCISRQAAIDVSADTIPGRGNSDEQH